MPVPEPALPIFLTTSATWDAEIQSGHMFYTDNFGDIVTVNPSLSVEFTLDIDYPLRPQEGSGLIFEIPSGLSLTERIHLPYIQR